jgi:hypothetical protein
LLPGGLGQRYFAARAQTVARVAEDCPPPNRHAVLRAIRNAPEPLAASEIAEGMGLPYMTAKRTLEDLEVLQEFRLTSRHLAESTATADAGARHR